MVCDLSLCQPLQLVVVVIIVYFRVIFSLFFEYFECDLLLWGHYTCVTVCLCWRCTWAGTTNNPMLSYFARHSWCKVTYYFYYWGGLHSAVPRDSLCGRLMHWCIITKLLGGQIWLLTLDRFNLGVCLFSANPVWVAT